MPRRGGRELDLEPRRVLDDVRVGDDVAVGIDDARRIRCCARSPARRCPPSLLLFRRGVAGHEDLHDARADARGELFERLRQLAESQAQSPPATWGGLLRRWRGDGRRHENQSRDGDVTNAHNKGSVPLICRFGD